MQNFMQGENNINNQTMQAFKEFSKGNLTSTLSIQEKGKLRAQPEPNSKVLGK